MGFIKKIFGGETGRETRLRQESEANTNRNRATEEALAGDLRTRGTELYNQGQASLAPALNFYRKAASGDHQTLTELLGPQLDDAHAQSQRGLQQETEFGPRSGVSNRIGDMGENERGNIFRAMLGLRTGANETLAAHIGPMFLGQSANSSGAAGGVLNSTMSQLLGIRGQQLQERQIRNQGTSALLGTAASLGGFALGGGFGNLGGLLGGGRATNPYANVASPDGARG